MVVMTENLMQNFSSEFSLLFHDIHFMNIIYPSNLLNNTLHTQFFENYMHIINIHDNIKDGLFCIPSDHKTNFDSIIIDQNFSIIKKYEYKQKITSLRPFSFYEFEYYSEKYENKIDKLQLGFWNFDLYLNQKIYFFDSTFKIEKIFIPDELLKILQRKKSFILELEEYKKFTDLNISRI